jgi:GntR family transcriptional regulator / MocR family aminotransferase
MRDLLFHLQPTAPTSLQAQIREKIVTAIVGGQLPAGDRMPSSRALARDLNVSRNTVTLAYQSLVDDGFLAGRERSGYYVNRAMTDLPAVSSKSGSGPNLLGGGRPAERLIDWSARIQTSPASQSNLVKPADWARYPYPFIYGQADLGLFPMAEWRDCARQALGRRWLDDWAMDHHAADDPMLVEQIRTRLLPRRGVMATDAEILITVGAQHALYLLTSLLVGPHTHVGVENPGYPDVRNAIALRTAHVTPLPVDEAGLIVDERLAAQDLVYVTPSHQAPTTVTMPEARRMALLDRARTHDFLIVEDDYEFETNYVCAPLPALKSLDRDGRVLYVGSLSKTIFPGLRLGYLVGPPALIAEARALRRLMLRHPPTNAQRTAALFLQLGHHDAMILRLRRVYGERWKVIGEAIERHLPGMARMPSHGGSSVWLQGQGGLPGLDADALGVRALEKGVVIEPGSAFFADRPVRRNCFRLGFSSIETEKIEAGVKVLAGVVG